MGYQRGGRYTNRGFRRSLWSVLKNLHAYLGPEKTGNKIRSSSSSLRFVHSHAGASRVVFIQEYDATKNVKMLCASVQSVILVNEWVFSRVVQST